ncbi:MAG TPA: tetratricopeptide repeat protein [Magnetospirillum sp.]|nr:tetratricopeptide repeat protein [Magnetospirillum sp.]
MRKILIGASFTLLSACAQLPQLRPVLQHDDASALPRNEAPYATGKRHLAAGQLGLAVDNFRTAVARDGGDVAALNALAACYDRLGRFDLADRYYDKAMAVAPDDPQTLNNLGVSNLMRGRPALALALLDHAARVAPDEPAIAANHDRAIQARAAALTAAELPDAPDDRPNRLQRVGVNTWALQASASFQPVRWTPSTSSRADEPPLPMPAPRPAVTRHSLEAPAPAKPNAALSLNTLKFQVLNGVGRRGMAARMRAVLASHGMGRGAIGDASRFGAARTVLTYHPDRREEAQAVARLLPASVQLQAGPTQQHDMVLLLGRDLIPFDQTAQR